MPSCGRGRAADGERAGVERVGPDRRAAAGATPAGERRLPSGNDAARTHDLVGDGPAVPEDLDKTRMQVERPADHGRLASSPVELAGRQRSSTQVGAPAYSVLRSIASAMAFIPVSFGCTPSPLLYSGRIRSGSSCSQHRVPPRHAPYSKRERWSPWSA